MVVGGDFEALAEAYSGDHHVLAHDSLAGDEGHGVIGWEVVPGEGLDGGHGVYSEFGC